MKQISFNEASLRMPCGGDVDCGGLIKEAFVLSDVIVVLLDPDENLGRDGQYKNLKGYNMTGNCIWKAELPTEKTSDVYWKIKSEDPLVASSFSSYNCQINELTGRIVEREYYK